MRKISLIAIALVSMLGLAACSATYKSETLNKRVEPLDKSKIVYIAIPEDGGYGMKTAAGSGQQVAQTFASSFVKQGVQIKLARSQEPLAEAMAKAKSEGASYIADASIANWEQRSTFWSGRPSLLKLTARIYDVDSGAVIDSAILDNRSRRTGFGSTSPASLMNMSIGLYVKDLYQ